MWNASLSATFKLQRTDYMIMWNASLTTMFKLQRTDYMIMWNAQPDMAANTLYALIYERVFIL